jgi:hypothetical protein
MKAMSALLLALAAAALSGCDGIEAIHDRA